jgi:RecA-family ATPase
MLPYTQYPFHIYLCIIYWKKGKSLLKLNLLLKMAKGQKLLIATPPNQSIYVASQQLA